MLITDHIRGYNKNRKEGTVPYGLLIPTFFAGFMLSDFPKQFIQFFTTVYGQFILCFVVIYVEFFYDETVTINDIIIESMLYVIILQAIKFLLWNIFVH